MQNHTQSTCRTTPNPHAEPHPIHMQNHTQSTYAEPHPIHVQNHTQSTYAEPHPIHICRTTRNPHAIYIPSTYNSHLSHPISPHVRAANHWVPAVAIYQRHTITCSCGQLWAALTWRRLNRELTAPPRLPVGHNHPPPLGHKALSSARFSTSARPRGWTVGGPC
jgi:hypothetical protein